MRIDHLPIEDKFFMLAAIPFCFIVVALTFFVYVAFISTGFITLLYLSGIELTLAVWGKVFYKTSLALFFLSLFVSAAYGGLLIHKFRNENENV